MRKLCFVVSLALVFTLGLGSGMALADGIGNIASAKVYGVNITAYENCPKGDNAQRIAVLADFIDPDLTPGGTFDTDVITLDKRNKIYITPAPPGEDFRVLDSNACDGDGAALQIPPFAPTDYNVFIRLVGKPDTKVQYFSCATLDADPTTIVCGTAVTKTRLTGKGEPSFTNATNELLRIFNGAAGCSPCTIFDPKFEEVFWVWNTTGKPHAQVWFVDCSEFQSCI